MRNTRRLASVATFVLVAALGCSDEAIHTGTLGPTEPAAVAPIDHSMVLRDSTITMDTAYVAQGAEEHLVGATVNEDGSITKNGINLGSLTAPGPIGPTGTTGGGGDSDSSLPAGDKASPGTNPHGPLMDLWCMVRIWYYTDTGEILDVEILYCWDDGENGGGGGGGGNTNPVEKEVTFALFCDSNVERGSYGKCLLSATDEDGEVDISDLSISWSSDLGASDSGIGMDLWGGTATEDTEITVEIGDESESADITVRARFNYSFSSVYASWSFSRTRTGSAFAVYDLPPSPNNVPRASEGSGPWDDRYYMRNVPAPDVHIYVHDDYSASGQPYSGSAGLCGSNLPANANYFSVNGACNTIPNWNGFKNAVLAHEREHENGINTCLTGSSAASSAAANIEKVVGSSSASVEGAAQREWDNFYLFSLNRSGYRAAGWARNSGPYFWHRYGGAWSRGYPSVRNETGQHGC